MEADYKSGYKLCAGMAPCYVFEDVLEGDAHCGEPWKSSVCIGSDLHGPNNKPIEP